MSEIRLNGSGMSYLSRLSLKIFKISRCRGPRNVCSEFSDLQLLIRSGMSSNHFIIGTSFQDPVSEPQVHTIVGLMTGRKSTTIVRTTSQVFDDSVDRKMVVEGSVSTAESAPAVEDPMVMIRGGMSREEIRWSARGLLNEGDIDGFQDHRRDDRGNESRLGKEERE